MWMSRDPVGEQFIFDENSLIPPVKAEGDEMSIDPPSTPDVYKGFLFFLCTWGKTGSQFKLEWVVLFLRTGA